MIVEPELGSVILRADTGDEQVRPAITIVVAAAVAGATNPLVVNPVGKFSQVYHRLGP